MAPARVLNGAWLGWGLALVAALLWPLALPGELLLRDMVVVDHPALSLGAFGLGDLAARNAPQDGVLALAGMVVPASWVARAMLLAAAVAGACGAAAWGASGWQRVAAVTVALYNPLVVERLLQGHWSLVIAAWLAPGIAAWGCRGARGKQWVAMWAASLTPTGAFVGAAVGVSTSRSPKATAAWSLACALPWLIPALLVPAAARPLAAGAWAFAPRGEGPVGTLGALAGLGGIWNARAVPTSRETWFALAGVALLVVLATGFRRAPRALRWLAAAGCAGAVVGWLAPGVVGWGLVHIPGAGLVRDSQKLLILALPLLVAAAGRLPGRALAAAATAFALLQVPDAPAAVAALRPAPAPSIAASDRTGDVLIAGGGTLTTTERGQVVVDPRSKQRSSVESGELTVDGRAVDPPSPRWLAAQAAWQRRDLGELRRLGVGSVVDGGQVTDTGRAPTPRPAAWWLGLALTAGWLLLGASQLARPRRRASKAAPVSSQE